MLEVNNYSNEILKDISFSLKENENLIILGANGAGKSTLAKVLSNLIFNENIKIENQKLSSLSDLERVRAINYIPPTLDVFDEYIDVYEFLELSFIKEINIDKINEVLEFLKIKNIKNRACVNLSSGEKQLLLLASSIIHDAEITIFDELTANMDISRVKEVYDVFTSNKLKQKIIITHNLDLAFHLKYKILYLENGSMTFFDESSKFFEEENLNKIYNNSLQIIDNHLVVKL